MSSGLSRALCAAPLALVVACSSPPPPIIPGRDVVGPPREAATLCTPPTSKFAQTWFRLTDLETGASCPAFVEQDECVVAIFRDCTDRTAKPPRSWLGQIDHEMRVNLARTDETTGGTDPHPPIDCTGPLVKSESEPSWVKLECRRKSGEEPHRGLYLEAEETEAGPRFSRIGALDHTITVATPSAPRATFVTDLALLPTAGELWAVVSGGGDGTTGLYVGATGAARLEKLAAPALTSPSAVRTTADERWIIIADGSTLHRLDARTRAPSAPLQLAQPIAAVEVLEDGVLVATTSSTATHLTLYDASDATTVLLQADVPGAVAQVLPLADAASMGAALLTFAGRTSATRLGRALQVGATVELGVEPAVLAYAPEQTTVILAGGTPRRFRAVSLGESGGAWELAFPGSEGISAVTWDEGSGRVVAGEAGGLTPIDLAGRRPVIQARATVESPATVLRVDATDGAVYALRGPTGFIEVFRP